ncbi:MULTISPECIES: porin family protein [Flavobacterium]|uniref:Outer membrane beta-barrel protein n=1 Tax=Flavobacterium hankyongi TaxID=1176532 RepID=A0ABP8ZS46_9FLAO|nr:porin family protein [Flavobacterium sp. N1846]
MIKKLLFAGIMAFSATMVAQTTEENTPVEKKGFYFKVGGSYFFQTVATEFPTVNGHEAKEEVYTQDGSQLLSSKSITGSFGEGFRTNLGLGYRFTERLGFEMGVHYYIGNSRKMANYTNLEDAPVQVAPGVTVPTVITFESKGQIKALDLSPSLVLYLGETKGFEPYTKVGVIVPVYGYLDIKTNATKSTTTGTKLAEVYKRDVVKPNPTVGFMAALGTSYKLSGKLKAFAEIEYRNFTVHGKTKETKDYTVNGQDRLSTLPYSEVHTNYVNQLDTTSNNPETNAAGYNTNNAKEELSSYVGISGVGLTLGIRYDL